MINDPSELPPNDREVYDPPLPGAGQPVVPPAVPRTRGWWGCATLFMGLVLIALSYGIYGFGPCIVATALVAFTIMASAWVVSTVNEAMWIAVSQGMQIALMAARDAMTPKVASQEEFDEEFKRRMRG